MFFRLELGAMAQAPCIRPPWDLNWPIRIQQAGKYVVLTSNSCQQERHWNRATFSLETAFNIHGKEFITSKTVRDCKKWKIWNMVPVFPSFNLAPKYLPPPPSPRPYISALHPFVRPRVAALSLFLNLPFLQKGAVNPCGHLQRNPFSVYPTWQMPLLKHGLLLQGFWAKKIMRWIRSLNVTACPWFSPVYPSHAKEA